MVFCMVFCFTRSHFAHTLYYMYVYIRTVATYIYVHTYIRTYVDNKWQLTFHATLYETTNFISAAYINVFVVNQCPHNPHITKLGCCN